MSLRDMFEGKKEWRVHMARVKALPADYRIVYGEMQSYLFKVGICEDTDWAHTLAGIVDLFEGGAAQGKGVLDVTGQDVAAFCDGLLDNAQPNYLDQVDETVSEAVSKAMKKAADKRKGDDAP
jgi:DNA-binding ferritin-like protein (Dps family)